MVDLEPISGLPIGLDDAGCLILGPDVVVDEVKTRLFEELTPVALDPETCYHNRQTAYYMYNGVYHQADAATLGGAPTRYELTLIPPGRIGREYVKTFGHRHCPEPESGMDYVEVCEVLAGTAHFVLHTLDPEGPSASMAFYLEARAGQKILLPPGFDHCTVNPGAEPLLFSDVIALGVTGIYDRFSATRGAAYLEVVEDGRPRFIANPSYRAVPPLRKLLPQDYPELHLTSTEPLYIAFVQGKGENWPFLTDPGLFWPTFGDMRVAFES